MGLVIRSLWATRWATSMLWETWMATVESLETRRPPGFKEPQETGMKWSFFMGWNGVFFFFSDEIMFLFFVRNWWIYVRNWWFLLGSSREKGEQMMVLCTKWDGILISYSHTVINMIEATRWFPICAEENKIINVLFPLPDWIIVVLPTFYNQ